MAGRCSGCGAKGSARKIEMHIQDCPDWASLFRSNPEAALEPEAEYARWVTEDRDDAREQRKQTAVDAVQEKRAFQRTRFTTPADILED